MTVIIHQILQLHNYIFFSCSCGSTKSEVHYYMDTVHKLRFTIIALEHGRKYDCTSTFKCYNIKKGKE